MPKPNSSSIAWAMFLSVTLIAFLLQPEWATSSILARQVDKKQEQKSDSKTEKNAVTKTADGKQGKQDEQKKTDPGKTADDSSKKTESPVADHPIDQLMAEWSTLRDQLILVRTRHGQSINKEEIEAAEKEFMDLYGKANAHIEKIQTTALERLQKAPDDEKSAKALCGILIHLANQEDKEWECFELAEKMIAANIEVKYLQAARNAPRLSLFNKDIFDEVIIRQIEAAADDLPRVKVTTDQGEFVLELFENEAPETVANFISLVKSGLYEGSSFHRVIEEFMAQGGKAGKDKKDVDYTVYCECYKLEARKHFTGSLSMAHAGRDTGSSEFFVVFKRTPSVASLNSKHTVFGRVIQGMDVVNKLTRTFEPGEKPIDGAKPTTIQKMEVVRDRGHNYQPNKVVSDRPDDNPKFDPKAKAEDKKK